MHHSAPIGCRSGLLPRSGNLKANRAKPTEGEARGRGSFCVFLWAVDFGTLAAKVRADLVASGLL